VSSGPGERRRPGRRPPNAGRGPLLIAGRSGPEHEPEQRLEPIAANLLEEPLGVLHAEVPGVLSVHGRPFDDHRRVPPQQSVPDGDVQGTAQDGVDRPHGGWRETGPPFGHDECLDVRGADPVERPVAERRDEVLAGDGGVEVDSRLLAVAGRQCLGCPIVQPGGECHRRVLDGSAGLDPFADRVELAADLRLVRP